MVRILGQLFSHHPNAAGGHDLFIFNAAGGGVRLATSLARTSKVAVSAWIRVSRVGQCRRRLRSGARWHGTRSGLCRLTHPRTATIKEIGVMAGKTDKAKGLLKETAGKATGDKRTESEARATGPRAK
jgi:hypothetical protein